MTEEELTQAAILKAQAVKKEEDRLDTEIAEDMKTVQAEVKSEEIISEAEPEPKLEYPFNVQLGKSKNINFKTWTGKTKKKLKKLLSESNSEEEAFREMINILIKEHIDQPEIYLSDLEQQYLVLMMRKQSLSDKFEFDGECEACGNYQDVQSVIDVAITYTPNTYPQTFDAQGISFIDIESDSNLRKISDDYMISDNYDGLTTEGDIEIAMHISKDNLSPIEIMNWLDTLTLKSLKEVMSGLSECSSNITIAAEDFCTECNYKRKFTAEDLPNVFSDLLD